MYKYRRACIVNLLFLRRQTYCNIWKTNRKVVLKREYSTLLLNFSARKMMEHFGRQLSCTGYCPPISPMADGDGVFAELDGMMLNNDVQSVDREVKRRAQKICKEFLGGAWSTLTCDEFQVQPISGGLSNHLYLCELPVGTPKEGQEPSQVVVRIYGQILQENMAMLVNDSVIFSLLSEKQLGPRLYGVFPGGRLEQFVPSRALATVELALPDVSVTIARKMARFHSLNMPLSKPPKTMFKTMDKWLEEGRSVLASDESDPTKRSLMSQISRLDFEKELRELKARIEAVNSPVNFCHNDLQEGNVLVCQSTEETGEPRLMVIDFEYCSYNYRGFDLGNHFNEWCYNYTTTQYPFFAANLADYPSLEKQERFFRAYIAEWNSLPENAGRQIQEEEGLRQLQREADVLALASHVYWALWSLVQIHKSSIEFGYLEYALCRFEAYLKNK